MTTPLTPVWQHDTIPLGVARQERGMMHESELVSWLRERGWTYIPRRRRRGTLYIYAQKRRGTEVLERYIAPLSRLNELTEEFIAKKLQGNSPDVGAATEWLHLGRVTHSVA